MTIITLLIKGSAADAARAAAKRKIPLRFMSPQRSSQYFDVVASCNGEHIVKVMEWFGEAPLQPPFPIGTLLLYSMVENKGHG